MGQKNGFMEDIRYLLSYCFDGQDYPEVLYDYLNYVTSMEFDTSPDFKKCRRMFEDALEKETFRKKRKDFSVAISELQKTKIKQEPVDNVKTEMPSSPCNKNRKRRHSEPLRAKFKFEIDNVSHRKSPRIQRKNSTIETEENMATPTDEVFTTPRTRRDSSEQNKDIKSNKISTSN